MYDIFINFYNNYFKMYINYNFLLVDRIKIKYSIKIELK